MGQANLKVVEGGSMDKQKALEAALGQIERAFGKGSVMKLGSSSAIEVAAISSGSIGLDIALGIGGLPKGRVIEIYGPEFFREDNPGAACCGRVSETWWYLCIC